MSITDTLVERLPAIAEFAAGCRGRRPLRLGSHMAAAARAMPAPVPRLWPCWACRARLRARTWLRAFRAKSLEAHSEQGGESDFIRTLMMAREAALAAAD
jgi:hypothetical protein